MYLPRARLASSNPVPERCARAGHARQLYKRDTHTHTYTYRRARTHTQHSEQRHAKCAPNLCCSTCRTCCSLREYILEGSDAMNTAVLMEDFVAVAGCGVAGWSVGVLVVEGARC